MTWLGGGGIGRNTLGAEEDPPGRRHSCVISCRTLCGGGMDGAHSLGRKEQGMCRKAPATRSKACGDRSCLGTARQVGNAEPLL